MIVISDKILNWLLQDLSKLVIVMLYFYAILAHRPDNH